MTDVKTSLSHALVLIALVVLAGCSSIPRIPTQNVLMFNSDGEPVDPTGNVNCPKGTSERPKLCSEEAHSFRDQHSHLASHPALPAGYYRDVYLESLFGCIREYFKGGPHETCRQDPLLAPPAPGPKRLLIFVHGGMNTQVESLERVVRRYDSIARAGYYPLFLNWSSSFVSSYLEQLAYIRQGENVRWTGVATLPVVFGADIARSVARAPLVWTAQTTNDARTLPLLSFLEPKDAETVAVELICAYEFKPDDQEACRKKFKFRPSPICVPFDVRRDARDPDFRNPDPGMRKPRPLSGTTFPISVGEDRRECPEMSISFAMYLLTVSTRLMIDPAVDALGTGAWENMLRRTRLLFNVDDEFFARPNPLQAARLAREHKGKDGLVNIPRSGGVSIFLQRLAEEIGPHLDGWEITLVGHSMGAIIINQMLRESMQLGLKLPVKNIVYMAAAASVRDVMDSVLPYLRKRPDAQFYNLTLHPVAEERESYDPYNFPIGPGPRGSLLVMIDNFFSKPETYLDRTAGRYDNFLPAVHAIPAELRPRVYIKVFSVGNSVRGENPQRHADFTSRFRFWKEACWKPEPLMGSTKPAECIAD